MKAIYKGKLYYHTMTQGDDILLEDEHGDWEGAPLSDPALIIDPTDGDIADLDNAPSLD